MALSSGAGHVSTYCPAHASLALPAFVLCHVFTCMHACGASTLTRNLLSEARWCACIG